MDDILIGVGIMFFISIVFSILSLAVIVRMKKFVNDIEGHTK